jgi:hypothetical protein
VSLLAEHGWRVLRQLPNYPQRCAVFPQLGQASGHLFLDTGQEISSARNDPHVYISDAAVVEMAKMFNMVTRGELDQTHRDLSLAKDRIHELEAQVQQLERFKAAVDLVKAEL